MTRPLTASRLQDILDAALAASGAVGGQLAVFDRGSLSSVAGGIANAERGTPMTVGMSMQVGSFSKVLTAVLIHQLAEQRRLDLDAPVVAVLPEFALADPEATAAVTPRQLLSMTSGIDGQLAYGFTGDDAIARHVATLAQSDPLFPPGTAFNYSGASTVVSARIAEVLLGMPWASAVRERILQPAGVEATALELEELPFLELSPGHAVTDDGPEVQRPWLHWPAGAPMGHTLVSNAADLARLAAVFAGDGRGILSIEALSRFHEPAVRVRAELVAQEWCLGPYRRTAGDVIIHGHGGRHAGGVCDVAWVAGDGLSIAMTTNTPGRSGAFIQAVSERLLPELLSPEAWVTPTLAPTLPEGAERFTGTFRNRMWDYVITIEGDALRMDSIPHNHDGTVRSYGPSTALLHPIGDRRFLPQEPTPVERRLQEVWYSDGDVPEYVVNGIFAAKRVG